MAILPSINLKAHEVRDLLNANGGKVDNVFGSLFRENANPTIYAKFKPTKHNSIFLDDDNRWLGYNGFCGINIPNGNGSDGLDSIYNSEWTWDRPTGGTDYPYRLSDWRGYNSNAKTVLFQSRMTSSLSIDNGKIHVEAWVYHPNSTTGHLLVTDSEQLGNFRLGVRVREPNGYSYIMTSRSKASDVANDSGVLSIDYPIESTGQYTVTTFLTYDSYTEKTGFPSVVTCYALPKKEGYVNQAVGSFTAGASATVLNCSYISDSLKGTYTAISNYGYNNPYKVNGYGDRQYLKIEVTCESSLALSERVLYLSGLTLSSKNALGKSINVVAGADGDIMNLYNSSFTQVGSISNISTDYDNPTICYLEIALFSKGVTTSDESSSEYGEIYETHPSGTYTLGNTSRNWGIDELYIQGV